MRIVPRLDGLPSEITLRPGCERDLLYVQDVDLKSSHYPWSPKLWDTLEDPRCKLCVAIYKAEPIGFVVYRLQGQDVEILRLGVKPLQRQQGIGTALMNSVLGYARVEKALRLTITIAEIMCMPGHPDDVSVRLSKYGFRAEPPIIEKYAYMYGQWVDGFRFVYTLGGRRESTT